MIKSLKEIIESPLSNYTGSEATKSMVEEQIKERWGETELKNFDPYHNTRTFHSWANLGYRVKKGEKALKSITFVETKDENDNILKRFRHPISLFYYRQVEKVGPEKSE